MPRYPRSFVKTSFFHVITQGIERRYIFDKPDDINFYIALMNSLKEKYNIEIVAYCIMNNHTHKLVKAEEIKDLSKFMQSLNTTYAKYYNAKYKRVGYVFRDRFKAEGIYSERQLYNCINYIYNNPVKAKICKRPEEYPYSNYRRINIAITDEGYSFLDIDEDKKTDYLNAIEKFTNANNVKLEDIKNDKKLLKQLATILKEDFNMSFRKMEVVLHCNREKIRNAYNE